MLTTSKPLCAGRAQTYPQREFTAKEQNYWSQQGVIAGEWQKRLAGQFGLAGTVSAEEFAKLNQGQHPKTGEQLVRQRVSYESQDAVDKTRETMEHRVGWDATFSAPKSVSGIALVGADDRVRDAHRESVSVALDPLEHFTQARIGGNHPTETTGKLIAAKFERDTARPVNGYIAPQLHIRAIIFNVTERDSGQSRIIQPQSLFVSQQFASSVYQSKLTYRLGQLGYEITTGRSVRRKPRATRRNISTHPAPAASRLANTSNSPVTPVGKPTRSQRTRRVSRKRVHLPGQVRAAHRKLAADFGHQAKPVVRAAVNGLNIREKPVNLFERVRESLTFSRDKNFGRETVVNGLTLIRDGLRRQKGKNMKLEDVNVKTKEAVDYLVQSLESGQSAILTQYLGAMAKFRNYSFGNIMLIARQKPDATQVAGYCTWASLGRFVRRGEKGIFILAPMVGNKRNKDENAEQNTDAGETQRTLYGFRSVYVFDISQTEGKELPTLTEVNGDVSGYRERLFKFVEAQRIELSFSEIIAPAKGLSYGGKITLLTRMQPAEEFSTLTHEIAHEMLHRGDRRTLTTKPVRETEAEAVAFVVCQAIGLETGTASADYIQLWHGDADLLRESLEAVQQTAAVILAGIAP